MSSSSSSSASSSASSNNPSHRHSVLRTQLPRARTHYYNRDHNQIHNHNRPPISARSSHSVLPSASFTSTSSSFTSTSTSTSTSLRPLNNANANGNSVDGDPNGNGNSNGNTNGTPRRLALLLDSRAMDAIATKLSMVQKRLAVHTDGRAPSPLELYAALKLFRERSDADRLRQANNKNNDNNDNNTIISHSQSQSYTDANFTYPSNAPSLRLLVHLLRVCNAAYNMHTPDVFTSMLNSLNLSPPLTQRSVADKFAPGYALFRDGRHGGALILCIRGSREAGDLLTNLSSDACKFLGGFAHEGIARSARELHDSLRKLLGLELLHRGGEKQLKHGLIICGHSLGGAVAAALTMLLRFKRPPMDEHPFISEQFANARCYSFAPPPFLDRKLMKQSQQLNISSVAYGLDVVPRMSPAAVDRLLQRVAAYDFSPHISNAVSKLVKSVTQPVLGSRDAHVLASKAKDLKVDAKKIAHVSKTVADVAGKVLQDRMVQNVVKHLMENRVEKEKERGRSVKEAEKDNKENKRERESGSKERSGNDKKNNSSSSSSSKERERGRGEKSTTSSSSSSTSRKETRDVTKSRNSRREDKNDLHRSRSGSDENKSRNSNRNKMHRSLSASTTSSSSSSSSRQQRGEDNRHVNTNTNNGGGWGGTAVNAVLLATKALGNGVEANAERYARRRDSPAQSRDGLAIGLVPSLDAGRDVEIEEMYLAGEVWHLDKVFVATSSNQVEMGAWPLPTMKRSNADAFHDIEVSSWMLTDHESAVILGDLERMQAAINKQSEQRRKRLEEKRERRERERERERQRMKANTRGYYMAQRQRMSRMVGKQGMQIVPSLDSLHLNMHSDADADADVEIDERRDVDGDISKNRRGEEKRERKVRFAYPNIQGATSQHSIPTYGYVHDDEEGEEKVERVATPTSIITSGKEKVMFAYPAAKLAQTHHSFSIPSYRKGIAGDDDDDEDEDVIVRHAPLRPPLPPRFMSEHHDEMPSNSSVTSEDDTDNNNGDSSN